MKTDIVTNPFSYDASYVEAAPFVGRRRESRNILQRLLNRESTSIVGERGIGKTSLLARLAHPDTLKQLETGSAKWLPIPVDLRRLHTRGSVAEFWQQAFDRLHDLLANREDSTELIDANLLSQPCASGDPVGRMRSVVDALAGQKHHLVLLLDDFDLLAGNREFGVEFLNALRSLAIHRNPLPIITSSQDALSDLFDYSIVRSSPFFNIFGTVRLGLLHGAEGESLVRGALRGHGISFAPQEYARLLALAGAHPYLLQMGGWLLYDAHLHGLDRPASWENEFREKATPLFNHYWRRCSAREQGLLSVLAVLEEAASTGQNINLETIANLFGRPRGTLHALLQRGLATQDRPIYRPFARSFTDWILDEVLQRKSEERLYSPRFPRRRDMMKGRTAIGFMGHLGDKYRESVDAWLEVEETGEEVLKLMAAIELEYLWA